MLGLPSTGDAAAILAALHKSQAIIEFELDGTIINANVELEKFHRERAATLGPMAS